LSTTTQQKTEFSNNNIKVKVTHQPGCQVHMDIFVTPAASKVAYAKAIKEVSKEISIPGFRRGKAPESTILQKFSSQIKNEWENILVNTAFSEALDLASLYPAVDANKKPLNLKIKVVKVSKDEESSLSVDYETLPVVPEIDLDKLELLKTEETPLDENKCQERYQELLRSKADWEVLKDKKIEDGDFVDVSFADPEEDSSEGQATRYLVDKDKIPSDFYKELIGRKANDSFTFKEGENEPVRATIKAVLKANLPEENDEFAKHFGAPDIETLKSRIAQNIEIEAKNAQREIINNDLINQIIEKFPMEVPPSMISKHRKTIAKRIMSNLKNVMPDSSSEDRQAAIAQIDKMIDERSRHVTHLRYIIHSLARKYQISVTDKEFEDEITQVYYRSQSGIGPYIDFSDDIEEIQTEVFNQMLTQKVLSTIIEQMGKRS